MAEMAPLAVPKITRNTIAAKRLQPQQNLVLNLPNPGGMARGRMSHPASGSWTRAAGVRCESVLPLGHRLPI